MKLYLKRKTGVDTYLQVIGVTIDGNLIGYAEELGVNFDEYSLDEFDLIKLDDETIYVSEEKLQEQEETFERIINEYGSLGDFFGHCIKMVNGGLDETN